MCLSSPPSAQHLLIALHLGVLRVLDHSATLDAQVGPCIRVPLVDGQCLSCQTHETALNAPSHTPQHTLAHHTSDPESHRLSHTPQPVTLEVMYRQIIPVIDCTGVQSQKGSGAPLGSGMTALGRIALGGMGTAVPLRYSPQCIQH